MSQRLFNARSTSCRRAHFGDSAPVATCPLPSGQRIYLIIGAFTGLGCAGLPNEISQWRQHSGNRVAAFPDCRQLSVDRLHLVPMLHLKRRYKMPDRLPARAFFAAVSSRGPLAITTAVIACSFRVRRPRHVCNPAGVSEAQVSVACPTREACPFPYKPGRV